MNWWRRKKAIALCKLKNKKTRNSDVFIFFNSLCRFILCRKPPVIRPVFSQTYVCIKSCRKLAPLLNEWMMLTAFSSRTISRWAKFIWASCKRRSSSKRSSASCPFTGCSSSLRTGNRKIQPNQVEDHLNGAPHRKGRMAHPQLDNKTMTFNGRLPY